MKSIIFSGECPECLIANKNITLYENERNIWECPKCHLQIIIEKDLATILRSRGNGSFLIHLKKFKLDCVLCEADENDYQTSTMILGFDHLENYIKTSVLPL